MSSFVAEASDERVVLGVATNRRRHCAKEDGRNGCIVVWTTIDGQTKLQLRNFYRLCLELRPELLLPLTSTSTTSSSDRDVSGRRRFVSLTWSLVCKRQRSQHGQECNVVHLVQRLRHLYAVSLVPSSRGFGCLIDWPLFICSSSRRKLLP